MAEAAGTLKRVFLELGGKSAFVVLDDAELRGACGMAAFTVCIHAGQGCAITTRLVVPRPHFDEAVDVTAATLAGCPPGTPPTRARSAARSSATASATGWRVTSAWPGDEGGAIVVGGGRPADTTRVLRGTDARRRDRQRFPRGTGGDLRSGPRRHPPRRGRRRRGASPTTLPTGCRGRCGRATATGPWPSPADADRDRGGQRRGLVQPRHAFRGLQAVGDRAARWAWPVSRSTSRPKSWRSRHEAERRPPQPDRARGMAKMQEVYKFTVDPETCPATSWPTPWTTCSATCGAGPGCRCPSGG